jgi:hypothetical protein
MSYGNILQNALLNTYAPIFKLHYFSLYSLKMIKKNKIA